MQRVLSCLKPPPLPRLPVSQPWSASLDLASLIPISGSCCLLSLLPAWSELCHGLRSR